MVYVWKWHTSLLILFCGLELSFSQPKPQRLGNEVQLHAREEGGKVLVKEQCSATLNLFEHDCINQSE